MLEAKRVVVLLTGQFGAGCTTVAQFLEEEEGFKYYRFSELIERAAKKRLGGKTYEGLPAVQKRKVLQDQGNALRKKQPAALANEMIGRVSVEDPTRDIVVEAARNPAEINAFKESFRDDLCVMSLDAPVEARFQRNRSVYGNDLERFKRDDARDKGEDEPDYGQRTEECVYLADISVNNHRQLVSSTDWDGFFVRIRDYLKLVREPAFRQPTYEELYMRQAYAVSLKSSCTKRQVGAIVVSEVELEEQQWEGGTSARDADKRESYVIATGFNDVPVGDLMCREQGRRRGRARFCPKDYEEEQKLREMNYCPRCGAKLSVAAGRVVGFKCAKCQSRLPRDFVPGRMLDTCRAVHAEEAAILQAAKLGSTALRGVTLYSTTFPCLLCAKSIINAGIKRVVYNEPYPMDASVDVLRRCQVGLDKYEGVNAWAFDRMFKAMLD